MPIFEFKCKKCEKIFEKLQMKSDPDPSCPDCGQKTERMVSLFGYKGSGADSKSSAKIGGHNCGSCSSGNCGSCH